MLLWSGDIVIEGKLWHVLVHQCWHCKWQSIIYCSTFPSLIFFLSSVQSCHFKRTHYKFLSWICIFIICIYSILTPWIYMQSFAARILPTHAHRRLSSFNLWKKRLRWVKFNLLASHHSLLLRPLWISVLWSWDRNSLLLRSVERFLHQNLHY